MFRRTPPALALLALLAACQPRPEEIATPPADSLLAIAFPGWKANGKSQVRDVLLADAGKSAKIADQHPVPAMVTPLEVVRLDSRHAVLLTQAAKLNHYNEPEDCHACAAWLGAYFFQLRGSQWALSARQDSVLPSGVFGDLGTLKLLQPAAFGHVAAIEWGSCWGGYCGSWLTLVGLKAGQAKILLRNLPLNAENLGAHLDCDPEEKLPPDEAPHACFAFNGEWQFEGDALLGRFTGWERPLAKDGKPLPRQETAVTARYVLKNGEFVLSEGRNPLPPL